MKKVKQGNEVRKRKTCDTEKRKSNLREEKWFSRMVVKGDPKLTPVHRHRGQPYF